LPNIDKYIIVYRYGNPPKYRIAVLLTFILACVFAEGTLMREDLDRTV